MLSKMTSLIENLKSYGRIFSDEAATKQGVVLPLLSELGWSVFNVDEVKPEDPVQGKRVDYSLRINGDTKVFIEVKRMGEDLEKHQAQLLDYSFHKGVRLSILTNGAAWWFYLPWQEGSWEQRKFYTIDILQQKTGDAASRFVCFLSRENVASGKAIRNAEAVYSGRQKEKRIRETIPKAWQKIISEPDELLIDLINETTESLCGYKADDALIEQFLLDHNQQLLVSTTPLKKPVAHVRTKETTTRPQPGSRNYARQSITGFWFKGTSYEARFWVDLLISLCNTLHGIHRSEFDRTLELVGRKRPYFTRNPDELRAPQQIDSSDIYVETNFSANMIVKRCYEVIALFGYSKNDLRIEFR